MTNSIVRSKLSIVSIALIAASVLGVAGAIYSLFPPDWYRPVSLGFVQCVATRFLSDTFSFAYPAILAFTLIALFMLFKERKLAPRTWLLSLPLIPMSFNLLWGAYCFASALAPLGAKIPWTLDVTVDLICILLFTLFAVFINILGSYHWKNYRTFALCILAIEFTMSVGISIFEVISTAGI